MITLKSYAKINITLDLVGKREDGYHLLRSVMQKVSLCDYVSVSKSKQDIKIKCNRKYIPTDERNIAYRAAAAFFKASGVDGGCDITLRKYIPCGAGLGGGSSNGAAVFDALCSLYKVDFTADQKSEILQSVGADVPFFFYGGTSLIEGIGEKVTPLKTFPDCRILIVKPPVSLSTAAIFSSPLVKNGFGTNSTDKVIDAINNCDLDGVLNHAYNALESASISEAPVISDIKQELVQNGAEFAMMSGSGSAVYGIFKNMKSCKTAYDKMILKHKDTYITKPINEHAE